ncbi:MAG: MmgE/PrpD family protein [Pseudomonadota bacterium]
MTVRPASQAEDWRALANWAAAPLSLSARPRDRALDAFIDTAACIVAGRETPAARAARAVSGDGASLEAFRLAAAAHALDWDDYDVPSIGHPSAVLAPVALAFRDLSGADALAAYVVGLEAMDRLGLAVNPAHYERGWHATGTLGAFGAAAAAGRALGLDAERMLAALSLAAGQAAGLKAQFGSGAKPLNAAFAARTGVMAAELAAQGVDARPETIWGPEGLIALYGAEPRPTPPPPGPGVPLMIETYGPIAKPHPCCGYLARIIDAMTDIAARPGFAPEHVERIDILAPPRNAAILGHAAPATPDEARFSPPYCVAATLTGGRLALSDFTPEALMRPNVRALAHRISFASSGKSQSPRDLSRGDPDEIEIRWTSGETERIEARTMRGGPDAPMTRDDFLGKLDAAGGGGLADLLTLLPDARTLRPLTEALLSP